MPARVTRAKARRNDENPNSSPPKDKAITKTKKPPRAPLADRTNSASDENSKGDTCARPRRARRIPARLAGHEIAHTPSPQRPKPVNPAKVTPEKKKQADVSPFKSPQSLDVSLAERRPLRVQRLPSRFSDHSLSPSKFVPLRSGWASTPLPDKKELAEGKARSRRVPARKACENNPSKAKVKNKKADSNNNPPDKESGLRPVIEPIIEKSKVIKPTALTFSPNKKEIVKITKNVIQSPKVDENCKTSKTAGRVYSPKLLTARKDKSVSIKEKLAVYEFTFDPQEEPNVPKKKRKKQPVRMKAAPRKVAIKDNYGKNVAKQLENLKQIVSKKVSSKTVTPVVVPTVAQPQKAVPSITIEHGAVQQPLTHDKASDQPIETFDHYDDNPICYSPAHHVQETASNLPTSNLTSNGATVNPISSKSNDPLNLLEDFSFFDHAPVARSSLRKSVAASPWRVDCEVHSKWPVIYVKPDMTPAYESSFVNVDVDYEPKCTEKPHQSNLFTDQIDSGGLKQTSILSFIKEVADKQAHKKNSTPRKDNSVFGVSFSSSNNSNLSVEKQLNSPACTPDRNRISDDVTPVSHDVVGDEERPSAKIAGAVVAIPTNTFATPEKPKSPSKLKKGVASKYFGFDDSEDMEDQENIPQRKSKFKGGRVLRSRPVLKDFNQQRPMRLTTAPKPFAATSEIVAKLYEEIKSVKEFPADQPAEEEEDEKSLNVSEPSPEMPEDSSVASAKEKSPSPVGLFTDIELVHYVKPSRKSYGKARKVTFQQSRAAEASDGEPEASDGDASDPGFTVPALRQRRPAKRKKKEVKMSKEEKEEAEAWTAGFNSMIKEVEEFPLVVE